MISIIISSYQPHFFKELEKNIQDTIGLPFEIIKIDNPGLMSISKAYNLGATTAKFNNLLFLHEDVLFHNHDWGKVIINYLTKKEVGVIGVAGSNYVPVAPQGWFINDKYNYYNLIQNTKEKNNPVLLNNLKSDNQNVFAIDGVFLAMRREVFDEFKFNEKLKGFHAYDLDISLKISKKYQNYVVNGILIEHFSSGGADNKWFNDTLIVRSKIRGKFNKIKDKAVESERFQNFVFSNFRFNGISFKNLLVSLKFLPIGKVHHNEYLNYIKLFYRYFRYKNYYEKKFEPERKRLASSQK